MRPRKLIIEAFGPFYEETVIDFDKMGNGVFLIAGDTGAGKTSIFDAMMFALYLKASGNGRSDLAHEEIYNNLAKKDNKRRAMRVEFSFECKDHEYLIKRKIKWGQTGKAKKMETPESELICDGKIIVTDNKKGTANKLDNVTQYIIEEILCLNALQFRQIIMLAQGEFQRFLEAKSDERGDILGKLYDNRRQKDLEERLRSLALYLKKKVDKLTEKEEIKFAEIDFEGCQLEQFASDERFKVQHPELLTVLEEMLRVMERQTEELKKKKEEAEEKKEKLNNKRTLAVQDNAAVKKLADKEKEAEELKNKKPHYEMLEKKLKLGEAAEKVIPLERNAVQLAEDCKATEKNLGKLERELEQAKADEKEKAGAAEETKKKYDPQINQANAKKVQLMELYPQYEKLDEYMKAVSAQKRLAKAAEDRFEKAKTVLEGNETAIKAQQTILAELKDAGQAAVDLAEGNLNNLIEKHKELTAMKNDVNEVMQLRAEITEQEKKLLIQQKKEQNAEENHLTLNKRFLARQAAVLAKDLKEEIAQNGKAACPVCGTVHCVADEDAFAKPDGGDVPTREDVEKAFNNWQEMQRKVTELNNELESKKTAVNIKLTAIIKKSSELLNTKDGAEITGTNVIDEARSECKLAGRKAREVLNKANMAFTAKNKAEQERIRLEDAATGLKAEYDKADAEKKNADSKLIETETQLKAQQGALKNWPENKKAAEEKVAELESMVTEYRKKIDDSQTEYQQAKSKIDTLNGQLTKMRENLTDQKSKRDEAEENFNEALKNNNFTNKEEYCMAMAPDGTELSVKELGQWIKVTREDIAEYKGKCNSVSGALSEAQAAAQGKTYTDTEQLGKEVEAMGMEYRQADEAFSKISNKAEQNRKRFEEIKQLRKERKKYEQAEAKVKPLADTATGGNKLPFDRYVLNDFFESIIDRANSHLVRMNDGMYCLCVYQDSTGNKKEEALNLGIQYAISEQPNKCAALSGGQKFEASLALAIGLSDVVQLNSTSAINIDSMFIDEGFGSLDDIKLDRALGVLQGLSDGKRQIGIISHVDRLEECLTKKMRVSTGKAGSQIDYETE